MIVFGKDDVNYMQACWVGRQQNVEDKCAKWLLERFNAQDEYVDYVKFTEETFSFFGATMHMDTT